MVIDFSRFGEKAQRCEEPSSEQLKFAQLMGSTQKELANMDISIEELLAYMGDLDSLAELLDCSVMSRVADNLERTRPRARRGCLF